MKKNIRNIGGVVSYLTEKEAMAYCMQAGADRVYAGKVVSNVLRDISKLRETTMYFR